MNRDEVMRHCREKFGRAPRSFSFVDRLRYLKVPVPAWLAGHPHDELRHYFRNSGILMANGALVWGVVVQANSALFESGPLDLPGEVIYVLDEAVPDGPTHDLLTQIAPQVFDLKGQAPTGRESAEIARHLTDERTRRFGIPVPRSLCGDVPVRLSTTWFVRKHLPDGKLARNYFPLLVSPTPPHVATVLPSRWWPREFLDEWSSAS